MREQPTARFLPDGKRLLLQHGPIDLVVQAFGDDADSARRLRCGHAPLRRSPRRIVPRARSVAHTGRSPRAMPKGPIARRMVEAVLPFARDIFITPMAAVAGAVAEEIVAAMTAAAPLTRAYVNNGGDIALHLSEQQSFKIGLVDRPDLPSLFGTTEIHAEDPHPRHCHQRLSWAQLLARHCRSRHRAGADRSHGGCGRHGDRQCGRSAGPSRNSACARQQPAGGQRSGRDPGDALGRIFDAGRNRGRAVSRTASQRRCCGNRDW